MVLASGSPDPRALARYDAAKVDRPPNMEVTTEVVLPVVAAAIPVVNAPRTTCAPIATFKLQPVDLAEKKQKISSRKGSGHEEAQTMTYLEIAPS